MTGKVYLIGAGPGDPGLITVKGKACLEAADVVLYDRLIAPEILAYARADAEKIYVGKEAENHAYRQQEINQLLVQKALSGAIVARLKGGDPFVFGRGAEEAEELVSQGIPFEVVPGVTSAVGALAYAGIPVTHRELASGFHVVTGHECLNSNGVSWPLFATSNQTLVILMGLAHLSKIAAGLITYGRAKDTPAAVVSWGTTAHQCVVTGTLESIANLVSEQELRAPAIVVVGDVVRLSEKLRWFEPSLASQSAGGGTGWVKF